MSKVNEVDQFESYWDALKHWIEEQEKEIAQVKESIIPSIIEFFSSSAYLANKEKYPYLKNRYSASVAALANFIEQGTVKGEFRPRFTSRHISQFIITFLDGLIMDSLHVDPDQIHIKNQLSMLLTTLEMMLNPA